MRKALLQLVGLAALAAAVAFAPGVARAAIPGLTGPTFDLVAKEGYITTADGNFHYILGFADAATQQVQYPGPTLIVDAGDTVTINVTNELSEPVSILVPAFQGPQAPVYDGSGVLRSLAPEAAPGGGSQSYVFVASKPGTYYYQSGTHMDRQTALGLFGAIIVYPATPNQAYDHPDSAYDREYLLVLSEIDPFLNEAAEFGEAFDTTSWLAVYWFINGRVSSDTLAASFVSWLPAQPYGSLVQMHPGERILVRLVNLGRDAHPFHPHGQHLKLIARDGNLLGSSALSGADLAVHEFAVNINPGQTWDGFYNWTGDNLGFDIYGPAHGALQPNEFVADHGKPLPVNEPPFNQVVYGDFYSGSPFLGQTGPLPPSHPGLNPTGAYLFMWHSHREMELTNFNDFPGGLMTFAVVEAPWVPIIE